jgi:hypothetical protein
MRPLEWSTSTAWEIRQMAVVEVAISAAETDWHKISKWQAR